MERRHGDKPQCSDDVLVELIKLVRDVIQSRCDVSDSIDRLSRKLDLLLSSSGGDSGGELSTKVDGLIALVAQNQVDIMGQFETLTAKADKLETEVAEITTFVNGKGAAFDALFAENVALTAKVLELTPNQITQADRDALAANEAKIQAAIDQLNTFTPDAIPPVEPPVPV